jgi:sulfur relay (sulfurtransferase) complex TusBCD TusD component (DsrE family)
MAPSAATTGCASPERDGDEVRVFLLGDAAACAKRGQQTPNGD